MYYYDVVSDDEFSDLAALLEDVVGAGAEVRDG